MGNKMVAKEDLISLLPTKKLEILEFEIQSTKLKSEEELKRMREELANVVDKKNFTQQNSPHDVTEQLSRLGKISFKDLF